VISRDNRSGKEGKTELITLTTFDNNSGNINILYINYNLKKEEYL